VSLRTIKLECPAQRWPEDFRGYVALGITRAQGDDALWLAFYIAGGDLQSVLGTLSGGGEMPPEIKELEPAIHASGDKQLWLLIGEDRAEFYRLVAKAKLHIGGDFREFGRLAGRLVRLSEQTGLWKTIDRICAKIRS
jgi:hypothetical protein